MKVTYVDPDQRCLRKTVADISAGSKLQLTELFINRDKTQYTNNCIFYSLDAVSVSVETEIIKLRNKRHLKKLLSAVSSF